MTTQAETFTRKGSTKGLAELRRMKRDAQREACMGFRAVVGEDADLLHERDVFFEGFHFEGELLMNVHLAHEGKNVVRRIVVSVDPTPGDPGQALIRAAHGLGRIFGERHKADPSAFFFFGEEMTEWSGPHAVEDDERFHYFDEAMPAELSFHYKFLDVDTAADFADWLYKVEFED